MAAAALATQRAEARYTGGQNCNETERTCANACNAGPASSQQARLNKCDKNFEACAAAKGTTHLGTEPGTGSTIHHPGGTKPPISGGTSLPPHGSTGPTVPPKPVGTQR